MSSPPAASEAAAPGGSFSTTARQPIYIYIYIYMYVYITGEKRGQRAALGCSRSTEQGRDIWWGRLIQALSVIGWRYPKGMKRFDSLIEDC